MKEAGISLRLDSFLDEGVVRRVKGIVRDLMAEKGYEFAEVTLDGRSRCPGGPKLVKVIFDVEEGPQVKIRDIDFDGNTAVGDGALKRQMKENKEHWFLSWITGRGTYQEAKFEEDADAIIEYYRNRGYMQARVGQPELKVLEDSADKARPAGCNCACRWTRARASRSASSASTATRVIKSEFLRPLFKLEAGRLLQREARPRRPEQVAGGLRRRRLLRVHRLSRSRVPERRLTGPIAGPGRAHGRRHHAVAGGRAVLRQPHHLHRQHHHARQRHPPRDAAGRGRGLQHRGAEVQRPPPQPARLLQEHSRNRAQGIDVEKTPNAKNEVDVTLKLEEQNRNQLTFGAGVSQFEGFFGQLSFQTANFLGRGEIAHARRVQVGSRAQNYQLAFTEPFLFDRTSPAAFDVYKRTLRYIDQFTQESTGGNLSIGFPVADFSRMFLNYSYEQVRVTELNPFYTRPGPASRSNPFLADSLLHRRRAASARSARSRRASSTTRSTTRSSRPRGRRITASLDLAGVGRRHQLHQAALRGGAADSGSRRRARRSASAPRSSTCRPTATPTCCPSSRRSILGGEYSVRGFDIRIDRPARPANRAWCSAATRACCSTPST